VQLRKRTIHGDKPMDVDAHRLKTIRVVVGWAEFGDLSKTARDRERIE